MVTIITGASRGIGLAMARLFASRGDTVYDFSRHGESVDGVLHVPCDVTSQEAVQKAVAQVLDRERKIDCLVCNAGYGIAGAVEFASADDVHRQFDVNLFGALAVVQAVLPVMRRQKSGTVLFTSSVAAVFSIPYQAFYSASKAALNAVAMALRGEVASFGIRVSVLMLGDVQTGFTAARQTNAAGGNVYLRMRHAIRVMEHDERTGMSPQYVARRMYKVAHKRNPAPFYTVGVQYRLFVFLDRLLPKRLSTWIVARMYR